MQRILRRVIAYTLITISGTIAACLIGVIVFGIWFGEITDCDV